MDKTAKDSLNQFKAADAVVAWLQKFVHYTYRLKGYFSSTKENFLWDCKAIIVKLDFIKPFLVIIYDSKISALPKIREN